MRVGPHVPGQMDLSGTLGGSLNERGVDWKMSLEGHTGWANGPNPSYTHTNPKQNEQQGGGKRKDAATPFPFLVTRGERGEH